MVLAVGGHLDLAVELAREVCKVPDSERDGFRGSIVLDSVDELWLEHNILIDEFIVVDEIDLNLKVVSACLGNVSEQLERSFVVAS